MKCALDHATCMCAMDSDNWRMDLDCITNFCSIVLNYVLQQSCWRTDIQGCHLAKWLQQCLRTKSESHNVNMIRTHWFVDTNGRVTHFEWTIFCWCGRTRKRVRKGNQKKARTGEGRQSAFTRSASFFWPDNGTQFKSVFCLQMQSQKRVGYQICEYTLLLKCLIWLCTMHRTKNHHLV